MAFARDQRKQAVYVSLVSVVGAVIGVIGFLFLRAPVQMQSVGLAFISFDLGCIKEHMRSHEGNVDILASCRVTKHNQGVVGQLAAKPMPSLRISSTQQMQPHVANDEAVKDYSDSRFADKLRVDDKVVPPIVPLKPLQRSRGGTIQMSLVSMVSYAWGLPAATCIAAMAGSLAYLRQAYIFSLSYGLSMLGIGAAVVLTSPPSLLLWTHAILVAAYGARLFAFLLWRFWLQPGYDGLERLRALDKTPPLQRTPIIISTSFFYALMASPLLFHSHAAPLSGLAYHFSGAGCVLAGLSLVYEAVADQQKSLFKMRLRAEGKSDELCTKGVWANCRHANYFGEIAFWIGSFIAGFPALLASGLPLWVRGLKLLSSSLGLYGIVFIMLSATKRLEGKQAEKYRTEGDDKYDAYYKTSNALMPKLF